MKYLLLYLSASGGECPTHTANNAAFYTMLAILQGDDTVVGGKTIRLQLPDVDFGGDATVGFSLCGVVRTGKFVPAAWLTFDFAADETRSFPLGVSFGRLFISVSGCVQTFSTSIPVLVTDSAERAYGYSNDIPLKYAISRNYFKFDLPPLTEDSTRKEIWQFLNRLREAVTAPPENFVLTSGEPPASAETSTADATGGDGDA